MFGQGKIRLSNTFYILTTHTHVKEFSGTDSPDGTQ